MGRGVAGVGRWCARVTVDVVMIEVKLDSTYHLRVTVEVIELAVQR